MKAVIVILVLVCVTLFYPRYDLHVKQDLFTGDFTVEATDFYTSIGCHNAANDMKARYYRCEPKTLWKSLFSKTSSYDPAKRHNEELPFDDLNWDDQR